MQNRDYVLEFLILDDSKEKNEIEDSVKDLLRKYAQDVELDVFKQEVGHYKLVFKGKADPITHVNKTIRCHFEKFVPLKDDLGDAVREQAFVILSRIEQSLREFVATCMLDYDVCNLEEHGNIELVEDQKKMPLHPLERTFFSDLIKVINLTYTVKDKSSPLTYGELIELWPRCNNFDEFKELIADQVKEINLWDEIFSKFVEDKSQWKKLRGLLESICHIRNDVMHYRPVNLSDLDKLNKVDDLLQSIIRQPKAEISDADRGAVKKAFENVSALFEAIRKIDDMKKLTERIASTASLKINYPLAKALMMQNDFDKLNNNVAMESIAKLQSLAKWNDIAGLQQNIDSVSRAMLNIKFGSRNDGAQEEEKKTDQNEDD